MCGFAGELRRDGPADGAAVERMAAELEPRGPDGSGSWAAGPIALAHRRLKVVRELIDAPNDHLTPLDGNRLWQLGLLELWLQRLPAAGGGRRRDPDAILTS